jgi:hypothetical protein
MNVSIARPSTSVSTPLMNDLTVRPVSRSTGSQNSRTIAYWKNVRVSRSRWCFAERGEVALSGRERVFEHGGQKVVAAPVCAHAVGSAPELVLVEADHLVGDGGQRADSTPAVASLNL